MNLKYRKALAGGTALMLLLLSGCSQTAVDEAEGTIAETIAAANEQDEITTGNIIYEEDDYYQQWNENEVTAVIFGVGNIEADGDGVSIEGDTVIISQSGSYVLSGKGNGQVIVDSAKKETVRLIFNGLSLKSEDSVPVYIKNAGKTVISLEPDTINELTANEGTSFTEEADDEPDAALFSKDDLTINGTGTLIINGNHGNGITSKDGLKLMAGSYEITAAHNGIKGKDYIGIKNGSYTVVAGNDGIKSTNSNDENLGFIEIEGGTFAVISEADGIQAETSLTIEGGFFTIITGGGSENVNNLASSQSAKGLKAGRAIYLNNGSYDIDGADDAIHSNGDVTIVDGYYRIQTGDDGVHADDNLWIAAGEIIIEKCYEGLESSYMEISGGEIYITASDDAINVAGGNDQSGNSGSRGPDSFGSAFGGGRDLSNELHISGGYIVIQSSGDGLDANGSIYMSGGTILINGPANGPDVAIDFDGNFEMTGGLIIGAGSSGMAQAPTETEGVNGIMVNFDERISGGTMVTIAKAGEALLSFIPEKDFQNIVFASADLLAGQDYELYLGGSLSEDGRDGFYQHGSYEGGELYLEYEQENGITKLGSQQGFMNPGRGGGPGGPGFDGQEGWDTSEERPFPADREAGKRPEPPEFTSE